MAQPENCEIICKKYRFLLLLKNDYTKNYIIELLSRGKYCFSKAEALKELKISELQFKYQINRLLKKNQLRRLTRDFFMIIPSEYLTLGSLPPQWIIDPLMRHLERPYYIGLLSASSFYGATNQQPMTFQVITNKATKPIPHYCPANRSHDYYHTRIARSLVW